MYTVTPFSETQCPESVVGKTDAITKYLASLSSIVSLLIIISYTVS